MYSKEFLVRVLGEPTGAGSCIGDGSNGTIQSSLPTGLEFEIPVGPDVYMFWECEGGRVLAKMCVAISRQEESIGAGLDWDIIHVCGLDGALTVTPYEKLPPPKTVLFGKLFPRT